MIVAGDPVLLAAAGQPATRAATRRARRPAIGYDLISSEFGVGYNSTLEAVVNGPGASDQAYLQRVSQTPGRDARRRPDQPRHARR